MNGLRESVAQVVNWSDRNVVVKERLGRVELETFLRVGDYCNALCEPYGWETRYTAAEGLLLEEAMLLEDLLKKTWSGCFVPIWGYRLRSGQSKVFR